MHASKYYTLTVAQYQSGSRALPKNSVWLTSSGVNAFTMIKGYMTDFKIEVLYFITFTYTTKLNAVFIYK